jgi:chromate transporter
MEPTHQSGAAQNNPEHKVSLWALLWTFLKIGSTTFGGFMALISVVQNYAVERKKWIKHEDMLDGVSLATILPGPVAINVVGYVGYEVRGWRGAVVSICSVMLPSFVIIVSLTYAYFTYGQLPAVGRLFMGFLPAVAAIILAAAWNMSVKTVKGVREGAIAASAFILLLTVHGFFITVAIIAGGGLVGWLLFHNAPSAPPKGPAAGQSEGKSGKSGAGPGGGVKTSANAVAAVSMGAVPFFTLNTALALKLLVTFGSMSLLLFGGGYVFIPMMQRVIVDANGWVTHKEFIDGIALGQIMPGPILISAAFFGYKVAGLLGAAAATAGMFGPPSILMIVCTHFLDRIKKSETIKAALRGIRSGVIGMIAAASVVVAQTAQPNWVSLLIFAATLVAILRFKVEVVWIIPIAGVLGLLLY